MMNNQDRGGGPAESRCLQLAAHAGTLIVFVASQMDTAAQE
jgi:hypothetical protein